MSGRALENERFLATYRAEVRSVWSFLYRLGVRGSLTEDLTQETFMVAFARWQQFDPSREPGPWLRGIAWRLASNHRRLHSRFEVGVDTLPEVQAARPAPDDQLATRRAMSALERALETLSDDLRAVFVMYELEDMAIAQIAELMDAPTATIYSRLRLARERLSTALAAHREGVA
jgi:RNA polymerase sigma-70 factor (ECF subfamily)